jgi:hypothetical protein
VQRLRYGAALHSKHPIRQSVAVCVAQVVLHLCVEAWEGPERQVARRPLPPPEAPPSPEAGAVTTPNVCSASRRECTVHTGALVA